MFYALIAQLSVSLPIKFNTSLNFHLHKSMFWLFFSLFCFFFLILRKLVSIPLVIEKRGVPSTRNISCTGIVFATMLNILFYKINEYSENLYENLSLF